MELQIHSSEMFALGVQTLDQAILLWCMLPQGKDVQTDYSATRLLG